MPDVGNGRVESYRDGVYSEKERRLGAGMNVLGATWDPFFLILNPEGRLIVNEYHDMAIDLLNEGYIDTLDVRDMKGSVFVFTAQNLFDWSRAAKDWVIDMWKAANDLVEQPAPPANYTADELWPPYEAWATIPPPSRLTREAGGVRLSRPFDRYASRIERWKELGSWVDDCYGE